MHALEWFLSLIACMRHNALRMMGKLECIILNTELTAMHSLVTT